MKLFLYFYILFVIANNLVAQGGNPWNNPLNIAWSVDGILFEKTSIFQDSSGVPSVIKWKGDTLIAAFQWFRMPKQAPTWDRVATKISYNNGLTWTEPTPIIINGLPNNFQRPFDPTLTVYSNDSIRMYFSSSDGMSKNGLDSAVNTYSAISSDGVNFVFEPNPRVDEKLKQVIDPAVIYFNKSWHYIAPIGSPQEGAYHYVSPNGINFSAVPNILSDNKHNWTGNFMVNSENELRFYGSGKQIWFNSSSNGGVWNGYSETNVQGGDPSVVKISNNNYMMVYVGKPYLLNLESNNFVIQSVNIYPNPTNDFYIIEVNSKLIGRKYSIYNILGEQMISGYLNNSQSKVDINKFQTGLYYLQIENQTESIYKLIKN